MNIFNLEQKNRSELVYFISQLVDSLSSQEKNSLISQLSVKEKSGIPVSIFKSNKLSGLEVLVFYLKEIKNLSIKQISEQLDRKLSTIYTTYNNSQKKLKSSLNYQDSSISIPLENFSDRKFSILESLVAYLKDQHNLSLTRIAELLDKNYNTVKTVYRRHEEKKDA